MPKKITLITKRINGPCGISGQNSEYILLLKELGFYVRQLTGQDEGSTYGYLNKADETHVIPQISLDCKERQTLFGNQFMNGEEREGIEPISKDEWETLILGHSQEIYNELSNKIYPEGPILIFNAISLRHYHPSLAVALKKFIENHKDRIFISHGADPDAERPDVIKNIHGYSKKFITNNNSKEEYSGDYLSYKNIYHIVLNDRQKTNCIKTYEGKEFNVRVISDFLHIPKEFKPKLEVDDGFLEYLSKKNLIYSNGKMIYKTVSLSKDTVFFKSKVRPIKRKCLKEVIIYAQEYGKRTNQDIAVVVTHPDKDDPRYHSEVVDFARKNGIKYIYTGEDYNHKFLENICRNLSTLKTVGIIASKEGGFENAIIEKFSEGIPVITSTRLNSYDILYELKFDICGLSFDQSEEEHNKFRNYVDRAITPEGREQINKTNYPKVYDNFSQHPRKREFKEYLDFIVNDFASKR